MSTRYTVKWHIQLLAYWSAKAAVPGKKEEAAYKELVLKQA